MAVLLDTRLKNNFCVLLSLKNKTACKDLSCHYLEEGLILVKAHDTCDHHVFTVKFALNLFALLC